MFRVFYRYNLPKSFTMLKDVILVPKDKCPLDVLAEMGSQTARAWIFLHQNARAKLKKTANYVDGCRGYEELGWNATEKYPSTVIRLECTTDDWMRIYYIKADDIAFDHEVSDSKYIFFLKKAD